MTQLELLKKRAIEDGWHDWDPQKFVETYVFGNFKHTSGVFAKTFPTESQADAVVRYCNDRRIPAYHCADGEVTFCVNYHTLYQWELKR